MLDECGNCGGDGYAGCTDSSACNYDAGASCDDGDCWYAEEFHDCDGNCLNDCNGDGICDEEEVPGCVYDFACNYNPDANIDDGSCEVDSCFCPGDLNGDNEVDVSDLLDFFQLWGTVCEE